MTAVARTRRIQPGSNVRWIEVERAAFHAHRPVFDALPPPRRRIGTMEWLAAAASAIVLACFWLASIAGYAVVYGGYRFGPASPDYEQMIPVSGVLYLGALVYLIGAVLGWASGGRKPTGMNTVAAFVTGILGALAAISIAQHGRAEAVENWELWASVVAGVSVAGFVVGTLFQLGSRKRVKEGPEAGSPPRRDRGPVAGRAGRDPCRSGRGDRRPRGARADRRGRFHGSARRRARLPGRVDEGRPAPDVGSRA